MEIIQTFVMVLSLISTDADNTYHGLGVYTEPTECDQLIPFYQSLLTNMDNADQFELVCVQAEIEDA